MRVTVKHLLRFLPMEENVREDYLKSVDSYDEDQRLALSQLCWGMYYDYLNATVRYEFEKALDEAKKGQRKAEEDLYSRIEDMVLAKFMRDLGEQQETQSIDEIRQDVKALISAKLKKSPKPDQITLPSILPPLPKSMDEMRKR